MSIKYEIITDTLHKDVTFMIISRLIIFKINILDEILVKIKIYILSSITFFYEYRAGYEIMWKY